MTTYLLGSNETFNEHVVRTCGQMPTAENRQVAEVREFSDEVNDVPT